jgi:hypothetical protein
MTHLPGVRGTLRFARRIWGLPPVCRGALAQFVAGAFERSPQGPRPTKPIGHKSEFSAQIPGRSIDSVGCWWDTRGWLREGVTTSRGHWTASRAARRRLTEAPPGSPGL